MTPFVDSIFTGVGIAVAFFVAAGWIAARPQSRRARRMAVLLASASLLSTMYAVPQAIGWLVFTRTFHQFSREEVLPGRTAVILLGGGTNTVHGWGDTTLAVPSGDGLERVLEAARVFNLTHAEWLISSGGTLNERQERDAITMRDQLIRLGIPTARIVVESDSQTTHEQAVLVAPILRSIGAEQYVLVTSDIHMPRSLGAFRAYGVRAVPAVAPATPSSDPLSQRLIPSVLGLNRSQQVAHEIFGITYYFARGWWR